MKARLLLFPVVLLGAVLSASGNETSRTAAWWQGKQATGDLFGVRETLSDNGLTLGGRWRGIYYGILGSENGSGNAFPQELVFSTQLDFSKALRWENIKGLAAFGEARWREPGYAANPNNIVDADSLFNPSRYSGGVGWRLLEFGLRYRTPELFGAKDFLAIEGGWLRPQQEFIIQPVAQLFANNAMTSAKGVGGNIPFSSSFSTWGGTLEVKPAAWHYAKVGLFISYPNPTDSANNGLMFRGNSDPLQNGLFFLGETGVTPEVGPDKLPGRYAFGGYVYGENNEEYGGNKSGYYWQADQMLWREEGEQGLSVFSLFIFAPRYNNDFSFYLHGGLGYRGLLPGRPRDEFMAGVAMGNYGAATAEDGVQPTQTVLMELGYRIRFSGWGFVQPFAQYISRPDGFTDVANAGILGVSLGVDF